MLKKIKILGVGVTSESERSVSEYVLQRLEKSQKKFFIVTPNPEIIVYAQSNSAYKDKLNEALVSLPDGVGVAIAARFVGEHLTQRITGVDFMEKLCERSKERPVSMGFLGGGPGVAERAAECLKKKYPWIKVSWVGEEWGDISQNKNDAVRSSFDILFVAFGFPKQEEWIYENLPKISVKAAMGVGGAFDYLSGDVMRAPRLLRRLGLEWLFRLIRQPWRIRRQLSLLQFMFLVFKESLKRK